MASLNGSKYLFFTTSPRSPLRMLNEIDLLMQSFEGDKWDKVTQERFMRALVASDSFEGEGPKDLAFAARDRINRGPKSLGFVNLSPTINVTEPGKLFVFSSYKEEILLRQLLKFQLPSPYHTITSSDGPIFKVKPYLEIIRLVYALGSLSFDELMLFGLQLTNYEDFYDIVEQIKQFRVNRKSQNINYKEYRGQVLEEIIKKLYQKEIDQGNLKLRESQDTSLKNYIRTKSSTMRDYTDACFRYLRATGIVEIMQKSKSLSIAKDKLDEVEFILNTVSQEPLQDVSEEQYKDYLFNPLIPGLLTDNKAVLLDKVRQLNSNYADLEKCDLFTLKELLYQERRKKREEILDSEIEQIKRFEHYSDIIEVFSGIKKNDFYDTPLMLEWNVWRALNMLDGGLIIANLKFDDSGKPLATAAGNQPDIICDYGTFGVVVEVTMSRGLRQYETEGESVARHLGRYRASSEKEAYCLFIAPKITEAVISLFYVLHKTEIQYYGGRSVIIPVELDTFIKMVEQSYEHSYTPNPDNIKSLFTYSQKVAQESKNEVEWFEKITHRALRWLDPE